MVQINNLFDSASKRRKLIIRFSILALITFFVAQVIPILAGEQNTAVESQTVVAPSDTSTVTLAPSDTSTVTLAPDETSTPSASPSPTPTYVSAKAIPGQGMDIQIPQSITVDPRAQVAQIARIAAKGPVYILICIRANNLVMDVVSKGSPDDVSASNLYLDGDFSSNLTLAGETELVISALNSAGGLRVSGLGRKLAGASLDFTFIATDKMADNRALCGEAAQANHRTVRFTPLGLGMGLKKGRVTLN